MARVSIEMILSSFQAVTPAKYGWSAKCSSGVEEADWEKRPTTKGTKTFFDADYLRNISLFSGVRGSCLRAIACGRRDGATV